jgi:transposase InsO family protein
LKEIYHVHDEAAADEHQRTSDWQHERRDLERRVRLDVLDFRHFAAEQGLTRLEAAAWLGISARTLRQWEYNYAHARLSALPLGRPIERAPVAARNAVIAWLDDIGPGIGLPTLQGHFPELARAELADLLKRYRRVWLKRHERSLAVLHWERPGAVWAMDFATAPVLIDGTYPYLLAVRDLASGQQLLWEVVPDMTFEVARNALARLFTIHGAPLVLKSDNGPAFRAAETKQLLQRWGVGALFSPPGLPSYNGSCEAGIGALKRRTAGLAQRHEGFWSSADLEAARHQANCIARPWGAHGPVREEVWMHRKHLSAAERTTFRAATKRLQEEARWARGIPLERDLDHYAQAAIDREAIRRALVAHGLLWFTRRRIPSPIKRPKVTNIM